MGTFDIKFRSNQGSHGHGEPVRVKRLCEYDGCEEPCIPFSRLCEGHWTEAHQKHLADIARKQTQARTCDLCNEPVFREGLCQPHFRQKRRDQYAAQKAETEAVQARRRMRTVHEPVRYQSTPMGAELFEARRRFPLCPQMSDAEILEYHRTHPRGWYESEGAS